MAPGTVLLELPFRGRWMARNSPAHHVPSHGTHLFGTTYAIDFIAVDERLRSAARDWRTLFATEQPDKFFGFDAPILSPLAGPVVVAYDGESDHVARRSQIALLPYALTQAQRVRSGVGAIAGLDNHARPTDRVPSQTARPTCEMTCN